MSAILFDLGDDQHEVMVNNASWRSTVDVIRSLSVLDDDRLERLATACHRGCAPSPAFA